MTPDSTAGTTDKKWCCASARMDNGWNHDADCPARVANTAADRCAFQYDVTGRCNMTRDEHREMELVTEGIHQMSHRFTPENNSTEPDTSVSQRAPDNAAPTPRCDWCKEPIRDDAAIKWRNDLFHARCWFDDNDPPVVVVLHRADASESPAQRTWLAQMLYVYRQMDVVAGGAHQFIPDWDTCIADHVEKIRAFQRADDTLRRLAAFEASQQP